MLYFPSIPRFLLTIGMQFAVDSPCWLCNRGRLNEAKAIIRNLWGPSEVDKAIEEFQSVMNGDEGDINKKWSELLEEPHYRVALVGGALFLLQQFAGINGGALSSLCLIDKQGRLKLLIGSYLGMATSMFLIAYAISFPLDDEFSHHLSILGTLGYIYSFAIGAGPVTGIIIPELSSSRMRGKIMSFSFSVHW